MRTSRELPFLELRGQDLFASIEVVSKMAPAPPLARGAVGFGVEMKSKSPPDGIGIKINVKGNGQECPFHTGRFSAVPDGTWFLFFLVTHGLRRGLHSVAASRLGCSGSFCALPPPFLGAASSEAKARIYS